MAEKQPHGWARALWIDVSVVAVPSSSWLERRLPTEERYVLLPPSAPVLELSFIEGLSGVRLSVLSPPAPLLDDDLQALFACVFLPSPSSFAFCALLVEGED